VRCSVLAVCCNLLQCVACSLYCGVLQCLAVSCSVLQCLAILLSVRVMYIYASQDAVLSVCVAACLSLLQRVAVSCIEFVSRMMLSYLCNVFVARVHVWMCICVCMCVYVYMCVCVRVSV